AVDDGRVHLRTEGALAHTGRERLLELEAERQLGVVPHHADRRLDLDVVRQAGRARPRDDELAHLPLPPLPPVGDRGERPGAVLPRGPRPWALVERAPRRGGPPP